LLIAGIGKCRSDEGHLRTGALRTDIGSYTGGCLYKLRTLGARFTSSGELRGASALLARTAAKILSTQMAEQDIFTFERINVYVKEANCGAAVTCSR
jgi:hypothetical protein